MHRDCRKRHGFCKKTQKTAPLTAARDAGVPGGYAAGNRGADYVKCLAPALAPEQGT